MPVPLPPLLSERPPSVRALLALGLPLIGGFAVGATLGVSTAAWALANVIAGLGGLGAGFDHDSFAGAARRGALSGLLFGLALVLADALVVDERVAKIADPAIAQAVVTALAGALLALAGTALRARMVRRSAAQEAAAAPAKP
jgi:hypothetical protein